jgi:hypothetical protein
VKHWVSSGVVAMAFVLTVGVGLAACGGDDDDSSGSGSGSGSGIESSVAPEDLRASDADVAAGLADIKSIATRAAGAVEAGSPDATSLNDTIEAAWKPIEGTIKANDADAYIAFEDNFAVLGNAVDDEDATKAGDAAEIINTTADKYLAEHPG